MKKNSRAIFVDKDGGKAEYAIRCFKDSKRKFTHKLKKFDAAMFKKTALHLVNYLSKEYGV